MPTLMKSYTGFIQNSWEYQSLWRSHLSTRHNLKWSIVNSMQLYSAHIVWILAQHMVHLIDMQTLILRVRVQKVACAILKGMFPRNQWVAKIFSNSSLFIDAHMLMNNCICDEWIMNEGISTTENHTMITSDAELWCFLWSASDLTIE